VSLTRGRITRARAREYPERGTAPMPVPDHGTAMASAAARVPFSLITTLVAALAALALVGSADGGGSAWITYLAPARTCKGSTDPAASPGVQRRAVTCLVNWARAREGRRPLARSSSLQRAALLKGRGVASCGELSHTPCGSALTAPVRRSGYAYSSFAENLFAGSSGTYSARDVVAAWLRSSGHRANLLHPGFRHVGAALVPTRRISGYGVAVVWITTFASPR
jgi:uncharacterized protein YkwD